MKHKVIIISLIFTCVQSSSLLSWFWNKPTDDNNVLTIDGVPLVSIPYEVMTEDEKFLQEASKLTDIQLSSPLEICQHKIIMKIRISCSTMSEEELAKLSVNLLNCQSAVEGRQIYPCTEDMSLKQCTTNMDADMWNAYHLISNRARAVCYAARNTQFRALSELTVNKLMQSARSQLDALSSLKVSHDRLKDTTTEALSTVAKGNQILLDQQQYLRDAHTATYKLVTNNLRDLYNEKALIRVGHAQLTTMTEDIKKKLEKANEQLISQSAERQKNHKELLEDLLKLQQRAELIWEKIESSTDHIVKQNVAAAEKYKQTLKNLEKINNTVYFIWNMTDSMRAELEEKLNWIADYIGNTGEQLQRIYCIFSHVVYLLGAMVFAAFLNAPYLTRLTIMGLIPLNLLSFLKHGIKACLDFTSITVLIILITVMHFVMVQLHNFIGARRKKATSATVVEHNCQLSSNFSLFRPIRNLKTSSVIRFNNTIQYITKQVVQITIYCKDLLQSLVSHYGVNTSCSEELSCSYLPSKKNHKELIEDYIPEHSNISRDDKKSFIYLSENFVDDPEYFRRRWNRKSPCSTSTGTSPSRSVSSELGGPKISCSAITKSGAKCRSRVQPGRLFCVRHNQ